MPKGREVPRLNQVLGMLVKSKASQISVANALEISSQSLGYYIKGRRIPASVIQKWQEVFGQNLIELSTVDFDTDIDRIVTRSTEKRRQEVKHEQRVEEEESITVELWRQLQKDHAMFEKNHAMFEKELERAWALIDRLLPQSPTIPVKRVDTNNGK